MSLVVATAVSNQPVALATNALDFSFLPPSFIQEMKDKAEHHNRYKLCMEKISTQTYMPLKYTNDLWAVRVNTIEEKLQDIYNDYETNKHWTGLNMTDARMFMRLLRQLEYNYGGMNPCKDAYDPVTGYNRHYAYKCFVTKKGWERLKKEPKQIVAIVKY